MGNDVALKTDNMPSLYSPGGSADLDAGDLLMSKVYLMQDLSYLVKQRLFVPGDAVIAMAADDEGAKPLVTEDNPEATLYILDRQRTVIRDEDGQFEFLANDYRPGPEERDVWVGFNYLVLAPDVDPDMPAKWLLIKTAGTFVYRRLNTIIEQASARGAEGPYAIKITTSKRANKKGQEYAVFQVAPSEGTDEGRKLAIQAIERGARLFTPGTTEVTPDADRSDF